jgi:putative heme-binding domain-containing protein
LRSILTQFETRASIEPEFNRAMCDLALTLGDRASCAKLVNQTLSAAIHPGDLARVAAVLSALRKHGVAPGELFAVDPAAAQRMENSLVACHRTAEEVLGRASMGGFTVHLRMAALDILVQDESIASLETLASVLVPSAQPELRAAAVSRLAEMESDAAFEILLNAWHSLTPQVRGQALEACFQRPRQLVRVLEALENGSIHAGDFDADRRQRFAVSAGRELRERVIKALATEVDTDRRQVVEQFRDVLALSPDAEHGAVVFREKCAVCHRLGDVGHAIGADLAALTDKSPASLLVAILDPNRALETKFVSYTAQTSDGLTHTGMLVDESGASITLLGQENKRSIIPRGELEAIESTGKSLMPEGLEKDLSEQDLADVMAFVANLPTPRKEFPGNTPELVRADEHGALKLTAVRAEVYGPTLIFEPGHQNLGFWGSEADRAAWNLTVDQPGRYRVWLHYACHRDTAGNPFQVQCGEQRLKSEVQGTGTWDYYRRVEIGELELTAGGHRITVCSDGPIAGHLMDLFELSLERKE